MLGVRQQWPVARLGILVLLAQMIGCLNLEEQRAKVFIDNAEAQLLKIGEKNAFARWNYESNITVHNEKLSTKQKVGKI